jgi:HAD superfamily phosphoserine phosphatase-like hydrolase
MGKMRRAEMEHVPSFVEGLRPLSPGAVAAFDADGTLWAGDIFDDFGAFLVAEGRFDAAALQAHEALCKEDELAAMYKMMTFFVGMDEVEFRALVKKFLKDYKVRWHKDVLATLYYLAAHGFDVVILSASARLLLEPVFAQMPIAEIIGMEFVADETGIFTGKRPQPSPAGEGKAQIIQKKYGALLEFAVGNSRLDAAFMRLARQMAWAYGPDQALSAQASAHSWQMTPLFQG